MSAETMMACKQSKRPCHALGECPMEDDCLFKAEADAKLIKNHDLTGGGKDE